MSRVAKVAWVVMALTFVLVVCLGAVAWVKVQTYGLMGKSLLLETQSMRLAEENAQLRMALKECGCEPPQTSPPDLLTPAPQAGELGEALRNLLDPDQLQELLRALGGEQPPSTAPAELKCAHCGEPLQPDWTHCPQCGTAVKEQEPLAGQ